MSYVMSLQTDEVIELLEKAHEKRQEEKAWQMWLMKYQRMNKKTYVPFGEFYKKTTSPVAISQRPAEDILKQVADIRRRAEPDVGQAF